jgi:hypothetical protein
MLRYNTGAERGFYRAMHELQKLQKARPVEEIGLVSQNAESPDPEPVATGPTSPETPASWPVACEFVPQSVYQPASQPEIPPELAA